MNIVDTRNLFISTETVSAGNSLDTTFYLPQGLMACEESQRMRLSLLTFSMRHNWYNINQYNNRFYIVAADAGGSILASGLVTIPEGNYSSYDHVTDGLAIKLESAISSTLVGMGITTPLVTADWNTLTNKITIIYDVSQIAAWVDVKHLAFTINNYNGSTGSLVQDIIGNTSVAAYQDVFEILGGCKNTKNDVDTFSSFTDIFSTTFAAGIMNAVSYWEASLSTEENIYLRTNLNNTSFQTAGYDTGSNKYPEIVSSNILAKIPIQSGIIDYQTSSGTPDEGAITQNKSNVIFYTDNGSNIYSMYLQTKNQGSIRLYLTDSYGRALAISSPEMLSCNGIYWTATLRVDVFG
jgi:hypothetical protein